MKTIDLNCDLGESFGAYTLGMDAQVIPHISSANIACGFHAGDPLVMQNTVALCKQHGVAVGAHPGLPDLVGFGRRNMAITPQEAKAAVMYQIGALQAFCKAADVPLRHVKPHGALYNMAAKDAALAKAICEGIREIDAKLILLALSGSAMITAAKEMGLSCASEVFADRAYMPDGTLVPRSSPDAMIQDDQLAITRTVQMAIHGKVTALDGIDIAIEADSVCVHGDNAQALTFVRHIRTALETAKVRISAL